MEVKQNNFTSFRQSSESGKNLSSWKKLNLPEYYHHPEFGKLPFNAPCTECVEILDRRTGDYRYFIDANDHQKFYVQKSLGDINFLENTHWVAKDVALKPITNTLFESRKSAQKVGVDIQNKRTYIETSAGKAYFNQWKLVGLDGTNETFIANANWNNYTIGEDGIKITNIFPDIDAQLMVLNGAIKTNFIIKQNNFGQYDKLVFRDAMDANQPVTLSFKNSSDLISAGDMNVHIGNQALLEIAEGFAFPLNGEKNKAIILNYTHTANSLDVIVPVNWVNINISSGPLVVDPLVTGTATLAQAAITGSQYNASCNFDNSCNYPLTIPTPPQATFTDVRFSFAYIASGICWLEDGAMKFQIGSCNSPTPANTFFFCNDIFGGTCTGTDISVFPEVSSCLPAPSCVSQNVVMTLKFYRSCYGSSGCSNTCIGANSPYVGVIEGKTLEFVNAATPITLATTVCQNQSLSASTSATAGVGPFTYNWSFNASGTPSLGTTNPLSITFPTAGSQTVYLSVTDACGNVVNASKVVNVTASPTATASSNSPVCVGSPINLFGSGSPAATTYSWTGPGSYTSTAQNPVIPSATAANAGTYSLTVTNAGCPSPAATTVVVVNPLPIAAPTSNSPVCLGGNLNLSGNTASGTTTYAWTGPNGFTSTLQNPSISPMTAAAAGTYTLIITNGGCSSLPVTTTVVVGPSPTATASSNSPICVGSTLNLTSNLVTGATYSWTGPNGFTSAVQNPAISNATVASAGVYTLVIDNGGCSSAPSTTTVVVNPAPIATPSSNSPICVGGTLNLSGNTEVGTTTYSWTGPNGFTSTSQNPTINPVTAAIAGTYTYTLTNGGCTSAPVNITVAVNPLPIATPSSNSPICVGGTLNLAGNTLSGTTTYAWTGPNGFTSSLQNPTINPVTAVDAGVYNLIITNGGCSSLSASTTVVINTNPIATASSNSPVCEGSPINLTSNLVTGASYLWTGPNGFTSAVQNPTIPNATSVDAGTYTVTISSGGCSSSPVTTAVVVNPIPTATPNYNIGLCAGGTLNLTSNLVAGATYAWTGPNGFTSALQNPSIPSVTVAAAGTYTLTITNAGCSSAAGTLTVVISSPPTATASYNVGVCSGGSLNLSSNLVSGGIYAWSGPNGFTSNLQNPIINPVTLAANGTYNLTITAPGCTPATSSVNVIVNSGPTATATTNAPICSGSTLNLNANTLTGATYGWTGPNGFTSSLQNPIIPAATSAASGNYILTITTPGCSPVTSTINVVVTNNPIAIATSNAPICIGATLNLAATAVPGATYAWTGPDSFTSTLQNPSISNTTALNTGTYSLTVTVGTCQSTVSTTTVAFHPSPLVNVTKTDVLCNGGSTGIATATPTVAGVYTFAWSPNGGTNQTASNLSAGVYTVVTTNANGCEASNTVTINQPPVISLSTNSTQSACALNTGTATVVATGGSGSYSYAWAPNGGNVATASNLAVGSYSVTVTDGNGCSKVANVNVVSANPPVITVTNVTNVSCFGLTNGSASITVNGGSPGYTYNWLPAGGNGSSASNLIAGQYTVTVTDNIGCTATEIIDITSPAELVVTTSGTDANCGSQDGTATATATGGIGAYTYLWTPGSLATQTISNLATGTYNVVVTDGNGCSAVNLYAVGQIGGLNIQVNPITAVIFEGESVNLNATLTPYVSGLTYSWSPPNGLTCTDCPNPTATPDSTTTYIVTITTPDGCADSVTSTIFTKINCGEYFIPTIFSPNGDGRNDVFKIYGKCIVGVDLKIFNRWGEKIFESLDQEYGWDGTFKGESIVPDSYYYSAKISFQDGTFANEKGAINVVK